MAVKRKYRFNKLRISLVLKLSIGISLSTAIVYFLVFRYINYDFEKIAIQESKDVAKIIAYQYGSEVQSKLNIIFEEMRILSHTFSTYPSLPKTEATRFFNAAMQKIAYESTRYSAVWDAWEYRFLNPKYTNTFGQIKGLFYKEESQMFYSRDSVNFDGEDINSLYYQLKKNNREFITEPYFFKLGNVNVLMTSVGVPVEINNEFAGMVGVDIALEKLAGMVDTIKPFVGSTTFLVSDKATIIAHPDKSLLGKNYYEFDSVNSHMYGIREKISNNEVIDFEFISKRYDSPQYTIFMPIEIANTGTTWALAISVPLKTIIKKVENQMSYTRDIAIYGFILLLVVTILISTMITSPLKKISKAINDLALGNIKNVQKLKISSGDEIQQMSESVNKVIVGLKNTLDFADKINSGTYSHKFRPLSNNDLLGISVINMRDSLVKANKDKQKRKEEDFQKNWSSRGLNTFSVILRQYNYDLHKLSQEILVKLVEYVGVQSGSLYLLEDDSAENYLELFASVGLPQERLSKTKIQANEGDVGRCLIEKQTIYMDDVPQGYPKITSGLGKSTPKCVLITPLFVNEEIIGIIELAGLTPLEEYKIKFVETVGIQIASTISIVRINVRTANLLEESRIQSEELSKQENEMRLNIEKITATQEEASKREEKHLKIIDAITSAVLYVEYDMNGIITKVNDRLLQQFQMLREQLIGQRVCSHEFIGKELYEQKAAFWSKIQAGEIHTQVFHAINLGQEYWLRETYTPIFDKQGNPYKVINIAVDISEEKRKEKQIEQLKERLQTLRVIEDAKKKTDKQIKVSYEELDEYLRDQTNFKIIRLDHLLKVYKGDVKKICNLLKIYKNTVPQHIDEIKHLMKIEDWELLKARIITFRTKMTYIGNEELNAIARQIEKQITTPPLEQTTYMLVDRITSLWQEAEKELISIEQL